MSKNVLYSLAFLLLNFSNAWAQSPSWQWGRRGGSTGTGGGATALEEVLDMATDMYGNVYAIARTHSQANVEGHMGIGQYDNLVISSWTCNGDFRWMKVLGGGGISTAHSLKTDTLGGVYVTGNTINGSGSTGGPSYYDTDTTVAYNTKSIFLVKYDTAGTFQWLRMPQPDTTSMATNSFATNIDMDADPGGNTHVFCFLMPGNYSGAYVVTQPGFHILRYNKDGVFLGGTSMAITVSYTSGFGPDITNFLYVHFKRDHSNGRYYLSGNYFNDYGSVTFGSTSLNATGFTIVGFIAAFSNSGSSLWVQQGLPDKGAAIRSRVATPGNGMVYVGAEAQNGNVWDGHNIANGAGPYTIPFAMAVDSNGNTVWITNASSNTTCSNGAVDYDGSTLALSGRYGYTMSWQGDTVTAPAVSTGISYLYLARFNPATGTLLSLDTLRTNALGNAAKAMAAGRPGNFYMGGCFATKLYVADDTLTNVGGDDDWFIVKYGLQDCGDCSPPAASFSVTVNNSIVSLGYTGSGTADSIAWDFGDGSGANGATANHTYAAAGSYQVCVTAYNGCGVDEYCENITINGNGTAIQGVAGLPDLRLYPNPVARTLFVEGATAGAELELYAADGRCVLKLLLKADTVSVDVSKLPPGIYLLKMQDRYGKQGTSRLIKM